MSRTAGPPRRAFARTAWPRSPGGALRSLLVTPLFVIGLAGPADAVAQERQGQQLTRQEAQARVVQQFERRVARELRLDRKQVEEVQKVMRSMLEERRELFQRRRALHGQIRRFEEEGGNEAMARAILSESRAIRAAEARIESEEEARLLEVLSPTQVLRFQIMRQELNDQIRRMQRGPSGDTARHRSRGAPQPGSQEG